MSSKNTVEGLWAPKPDHRQRWYAEVAKDFKVIESSIAKARRVMDRGSKELNESESPVAHIQIGVADESLSRYSVRTLAESGHLPKKYLTLCSTLSAEELNDVLRQYKNGTLSGPNTRVKR